MSFLSFNGPEERRSCIMGTLIRPEHYSEIRATRGTKFAALGGDTRLRDLRLTCPEQCCATVSLGVLPQLAAAMRHLHMRAVGIDPPVARLVGFQHQFLQRVALHFDRDRLVVFCHVPHV